MKQTPGSVHNAKKNQPAAPDRMQDYVLYVLPITKHMKRMLLMDEENKPEFGFFDLVVSAIALIAMAAALIAVASGWH